MKQTTRIATQSLIWGCLYVAGAFVAQINEGPVSQFWFPTGIFTASIIIHAPSTILRSALIALYSVVILTMNTRRHKYPNILGLWLANLIQGLLPVVIVQFSTRRSWWKDWRPLTFKTFKETISYVISCLFCASISSAFGSMSVFFANHMDFGILYFRWFTAVILMLLILAPLIVTGFDQFFEIRQYGFVWRRRKIRTISVIFLLLFLPVPVLLRANLSGKFVGDLFGLYVDFPLVIILMVIGGRLIGCLANAIVTISTITIVYLYPYSFLDNGKPNELAIAERTVFLVIMAITSKIFGALFYERSHNLQLVEEIVKERTKELSDARLLAEKLSNSKSQFMAFLCHELRNPLHAVINIAEMIMPNDIPKSSEVCSSLQTILSYGKYMMSLLIEVLDLERMEKGIIRIQKQPWDLGVSLKEVKYRVEHSLASKNISMTFNIDESIPRLVIMDGIRYTQVLCSLCSYAIKHTESGQVQVEIKAVRGEDRRLNIVSTVIENGPGIKPEFVQDLFKPYAQVTHDIQEYGGSGLGLSISALIVNLLGGRISVESVYGHGSKLTFSIPVEEDTGSSNEDHPLSVVIDIPGFSIPDEQEESEIDDMSRSRFRTLESITIADIALRMSTCTTTRRPSKIRRQQVSAILNGLSADQDISLKLRKYSTKTPAKRHKSLMRNTSRSDKPTSLPLITPTDERKRILIVDDAGINRMILKKMLNKVSCLFLLEEAEDGLDAVTKASTTKYDVIFMDIVMPKMDGYEASEKIRQFDNQVKIIIASANNVTGPDSAIKHSSIGITDVLGKPFTTTNLKQILEKHGLIDF